MTLVDGDSHVIHQNWNLIGSTYGKFEEEKEGEEKPLYVFKFIGFEQNGTFQYDGRQLAVGMGVIYR